MYVQRIGNGDKSWVFLHGFFGAGRNLTTLAKSLVSRSPDHSVYLVDLLGHGKSPALPADADLQTIAYDLHKLLEEIHGPYKAKLLGHSLGGRVALVTRNIAASVLDKVVLLDIGVKPVRLLPDLQQFDFAGSEASQKFANDDLTRLFSATMAAPETASNRQAMRQWFFEKMPNLPNSLVDWMLTNLYVSEDGFYRWRVDRFNLAQFHKRVAPVDLTYVFKQNKQQLLLPEVLCIRGGKSPFIDEDHAKHLIELGVQVKTIENSGHFVHVDAQEALLHDLLQLG